MGIKGRVLTGIGIAVVASATAPARAQAIHPDCIAARLSAAVVAEAPDANIERLKPVVDDYCAHPASASDAQAPAYQAVRQAAQVIHAAATMLGVTPEQLMPTPYTLQIVRNPLGLLASLVRSSYSNRTVSTTIYMGVFTDWRNGPINEGVLAHEFGHAISEGFHNDHLPTVYQQLAGTALMREMVADLIAIEATGSIVTAEDGLPECLRNFRVVKPGLSYDTQADFFSPLTTWKGHQSCCQSLDRSGQHTAHSREFCAFRQATRTKPPIKSYGTQRFDAAFYEAHNDGYTVDAHQLGLPLNSMLLALQSETGVRVIPLLMQAMTDTALAQPVAYTCVVPKLTEFLPTQRETAHTLAQVFERLEQLLPEDARAAYARLSKQTRLDIWAKVSVLDSANIAIGSALNHGADGYNDLSAGRPSGVADPRLRSTGCWRFSTPDRSSTGPGSLDDELEGCTFSCRADATS